MVTPLYSASPSSVELTRQVQHLIRRRKGLPLGRLRPAADLHTDLGFDLLDVVDIILALEQRYQLTIPDELPLRTIDDFVRFLGPALAGTSTAQAA
ncbi:acyl carrier protein [Hymenobacter gummosus]|uniref:Acyl carrier protein n=1 Tax=Hymenobacter gummosus TaxID=1776032 RepID=A0A3S0JL50_9BACT|nr:phosphopantetheine-binding protein [Hymenobacter gummosus]RTQ53723.1 acyl carrier protein [Hymenobacter gummosus]